MDELLDILADLHPDIDFDSEDALVDDEILDSFDIVTLVSEINERLDVEIGARDITPENFNSVDSMWELIQKLKEEED